MLNNDYITHPNFLAVSISNDNASGRAPRGWWFCIIFVCAALAPMDEEVIPSAHLGGPKWF
jgi:hypothetical protein